jgi:hypothetical protein
MNKSVIEGMFPIIERWNRELTPIAQCRVEATLYITAADFGKKKKDQETILRNINDTKENYSRERLIQYLQNSLLKALGFGMGRGQV